MEVAKIFQSGRSQAIRLPKAFRFEGKEVVVKHFGNGVLLLPLNNPWEIMQEAVFEFEDNFLFEREDQGIQSREELL
ncbi:type II toxin-antitoxin system VapB family antitoxin [Acinetobacter sp. I-MWF]|uniref:antitoxin n=1 Tax=Acinetobacter TaxID=469 RepID=UPI0021CADCA0|nr:type II toxin-antitoxin system VapB family antitoxin [Acinetobacter sp. I-MWF]MCT9980163.1 type II toxin-antitoxin system VapB family antitoxin [Acinetobacter sp. I-MWF]